MENGAAVQSLPPAVTGLLLALCRCDTGVRVYWQWAAHGVWLCSLVATPLGGDTSTKRLLLAAFTAYFIFLFHCSHCLSSTPIFNRVTWWMGFLSWERTTVNCRWAWSASLREAIPSLYSFSLPQFIRFCQFKRRNRNTYLGGIAEVDLRLSYFLFSFCCTWGVLR